jgi:hypothetical protein
VIKRARHIRQIIEIPECCVCMEVAAPLVVYDCDHIGCGPCTRKLEEPREWLSAGFKCPQCRLMVYSYTVPLFMREKTLDAASDEQRELAEDFLRHYQESVSIARMHQRQREGVGRVIDRRPRRIEQVRQGIRRHPPPNRTAVDAELAMFFSRVPHQLDRWQVNAAGSFTTDIMYVRDGMLSRTADRRSFARRLRARLSRGGIFIRSWTINIVRLCIFETRTPEFSRMRW